MARGGFTTSNYFRKASAAVTAPPFTMSAWWYLTGWQANYQMLIQVGRSNSGDHRHSLAVGISSDPTVSAYSRTTVGNPSDMTISAADHNKWNHQAGVWRATNNRQVYFNGVAGVVNTETFAPTSLNSTSIGIQTNGVNDPAGNSRIAEAAIWDVELTAAELAALAKGFSPLLIRPDRLVEYMPLVRGNWSMAGMGVTGAPGIADHPRIITRAA